MFKKIVVGLDGSNVSESALRIACDLAQKYDAKLHIIHVPQPQTVAFALGAVAGYHAVTTMPPDEDVKVAAQRILESGVSIAKSWGQKTVEAYVSHGTPADEIIKYADDCGADLIITGRRGLGSIGSIIQGSTSQRVNHLARCACLSVA